jgi:hypothetical protein
LLSDVQHLTFLSDGYPRMHLEQTASSFRPSNWRTLTIPDMNHNLQCKSPSARKHLSGLNKPKACFGDELDLVLVMAFDSNEID